MRGSRLLCGVSAIFLGFGAIALADPAWAAPTSASATVALPEVVAVPATTTSRPFLAASPADLDAVGYVEEEFFLAGQASVYEWEGTDGRVKVVAGPGKYTNRILVRRPKDPARFGGNIEVNLLNATTLVDRGSPLDFERMAAEGNVWIGITTKSLTVATLKKFDPQRYAPLDWSNPAPEAQRCQDPSIIPLYTTGNVNLRMMPLMMRDTTQEDGLVWDMIGQIALLLKSDGRDAVLPGFAKPRLFMTGISQSALMINTWVAAFHDRYRTAGGEPAFNGYMPIVGANMLRLAQCSTDVLAEDPRNKAPLLDVPIVKIYSEAEMNYGRYTRRPNEIKGKAGVVTYEVAGAPHARGDLPGKALKMVGVPSAEDVAKSLAGLPDMPRPPLPAGLLPNDFPWASALRGALFNLEQWANKGIAPPQTQAIELDASRKVVRDADGNARGGLRLPEIDVPTARYVGALSESGLTSIMGGKEPFGREKLKSLYGDHRKYVAKYDAATGAALKARLILSGDAADMRSAARAADVP